MGMEKRGEGVWRAVEKDMANNVGAESGDMDVVAGERKSRAGRVANAAVGDLVAAKRMEGEGGAMASGTGSDLGVCRIGVGGNRERGQGARNTVDDGNGVCKLWEGRRGECQSGTTGRWELRGDNVRPFHDASGWGIAISDTAGDDLFRDVAKRG